MSLGVRRGAVSVLFILGLSLGGQVYADESDAPAEGQISVELGGGQARVFTQGFELPPEVHQRLETDLMVDDRLSKEVTSAQPVRITLDPGETQKLLLDYRRAADAAATRIHDLVAAGVTGSLPGDRSQEPTKGKETEVLFDEDLRVASGEWLRDVVVIWGDAEIKGRVDHLVVIGGDVMVAPGGRIAENVVVIGGELEVMGGARVDGHQTVIPFRRFEPEWQRHWQEWGVEPLAERWFSGWAILGMGVLGWLWAWLVVAGLKALWPNLMQDMAALCFSSLFLNFMVGTGYIVTFFPALLFLVVTLVGILLVPFYLVASILFAIVSYPLALWLIGEKMIIKRPLSDAWRLAIGQMVFVGLGFLPVLGSWLKAVTLLVTLGIVLRVIFRRVFRAS